MSYCQANALSNARRLDGAGAWHRSLLSGSLPQIRWFDMDRWWCFCGRMHGSSCSIHKIWRDDPWIETSRWKPTLRFPYGEGVVIEHATNHGMSLYSVLLIRFLLRRCTLVSHIRGCYCKFVAGVSNISIKIGPTDRDSNIVISLTDDQGSLCRRSSRNTAQTQRTLKQRQLPYNSNNVVIKKNRRIQAGAMAFHLLLMGITSQVWGGLSSRFDLVSINYIGL
jgi:hypothetical protein